MSSKLFFKRIVSSMLAFVLVLSFASCAEKGLTKEEYMAQCEEPLSFHEYKDNPDQYVGKPYKASGIVTQNDVQNPENSKDIYTIVVLGNKGGISWAGTHSVIDGNPCKEGDRVTLYGDFIKVVSDNNTVGVILDIKYIELN